MSEGFRYCRPVVSLDGQNNFKNHKTDKSTNNFFHYQCGTNADISVNSGKNLETLTIDVFSIILWVIWRGPNIIVCNDVTIS